MLSPTDIARLCQRKYPAFLESLARGQSFFPLEIRFGQPSTSADWGKLQMEIAALAGGQLGYRVEWAEINTRRWGRQKFPERVWFEEEGEFLRALGKTEEVQRFRTNLALTRERLPELGEWLPGNARRVVEFADAWPSLLLVCRYFLQHPQPGVYAREVPAAPDTKFIDRHQGILRDLLEFLLPEEAGRRDKRFEERFGLRYDEPLIRCRLLDPALTTRLRLSVTDLAVPFSQFGTLDASGLTAIIAENKMTFLTLPTFPGTIGIWGGGGAAEVLTSVPWLAACPIIYWGDLDVHGFHILSRLRQTYSSITSVMMDEATLDRCENLLGSACEARYEEVSGLTPGERKAYERVRAKALLLEQERIPHAYALEQLLAALRMCHAE